MDGEHIHVAHGLRIASTRRLDALPATGGGRGRPDVTLRWGSSCERPVPPRTTTVLECRTSDGTLYTALSHDDAYRLQFHDTCEFVIDRDTCTVVCTPAPGTPPALTEVLASGALLAFVLTMRGDCVLHASAVQIDDLAVAIVGGSGFGKSTVTAALCAAGCRLVTDDILVVDIDAVRQPVARPGTREVRLRAGARGLRRYLPPDVVARETADGRLAVTPRRTSASALTLGALVVPRLRRGLDTIALERLSSNVAFRGLLAHPRLHGWMDRDVLARQLDQMADLCRRVPMYVADLPAGSLMDTRMATHLRDALGTRVRHHATSF